MAGKHATPRQAAPNSSDAALAFRLHAAVLHLMRRIRHEDERSGLSAPAMSALSCVAFGTPRTLGELAAMEQVAPPTMTRVVSALERDGYVARRRDAADGRVAWIEATAKGRRVIEEGRSRRVAFVEAQIARLSARDRRALEMASAVMERMYGTRDDGE
jgi:DNA-binding MarR family transcriptional regulator